MNKTIWYVGGKSAGHIMPLITLAHKNQKESVFITTHRPLDKQIIDTQGKHLEHCALYLPDIDRKKIWLYPWHILMWLYAGVRLSQLYFKRSPEKIISTGGLIAVPIFLWAYLLRIPCELFELNAFPGDAVRLLAPLSKTIFYCYKTAARYLPEKKIQYRPYPVRTFDGVSLHEARLRLGLDPQKKTICFLGGSQGSHFINNFAKKIVAQFPITTLQIIHQAGSEERDAVVAWYAQHAYKAFVVDYYSPIELLYSAADVVVCRAGAGTLWELEYMNILTCIIPLETAITDHQIHNAHSLCSQKPQQFMMFSQKDAEKNSESFISFAGLESQLHEASPGCSGDDQLFHQ